MKYQFIEQNKQEFPVAVICRVLEVSESGFYAWRNVPPVNAGEKMLSLFKRFGRSLSRTEADTEVHASMWN